MERIKMYRRYLMREDLKNERIVRELLSQGKNIYEGFPRKEDSNASKHKSILNYFYKDIRLEGINSDAEKIELIEFESEDNSFYEILNNNFNVYLLSLELRGEGGRAIKVLVGEDERDNYYIVDMREDEFYNLSKQYYDDANGFVLEKGQLKGRYKFYSKGNNFRVVNSESILLKEDKLIDRIKSYKTNKEYRDTIFNIDDYREGELFLVVNKDNGNKNKKEYGLGVKLLGNFYLLGEYNRYSQSGEMFNEDLLKHSYDNIGCSKLIYNIMQQFYNLKGLGYDVALGKSFIELSKPEVFDAVNFKKIDSYGRDLYFKDGSRLMNYMYVLDLGNNKDSINEYYETQSKTALYLYKTDEFLSEEGYNKLISDIVII